MTTDQQINQSVSDLEKEMELTTILAVESGSRAWGFPSEDSDYDVRIIYRHNQDWYLSVFKRKDHLNLPITDELDIAGWDIRKVLLLLYKGNAVVHEWLKSPVIYHRDEKRTVQLREFAEKVFDPAMALRHYISMAAKKLDSEESGAFTAKRLLYGYRTLLCARWVTEYQSAPPMEFSQLRKEFTKDNSEVNEGLKSLIKAKASGSEKDEIEVARYLNDYGAVWISKLKKVRLSGPKQQTEIFDEIFKSLVME